jgi:hypothetical protein
MDAPPNPKFHCVPKLKLSDSWSRTNSTPGSWNCACGEIKWLCREERLYNSHWIGRLATPIVAWSKKVGKMVVCTCWCSERRRSPRLLHWTRRRPRGGLRRKRLRSGRLRWCGSRTRRQGQHFVILCIGDLASYRTASLANRAMATFSSINCLLIFIFSSWCCNFTNFYASLSMLPSCGKVNKYNAAWIFKACVFFIFATAISDAAWACARIADSFYLTFRSSSFACLLPIGRVNNYQRWSKERQQLGRCCHQCLMNLLRPRRL